MRFLKLIIFFLIALPLYFFAFSQSIFAATCTGSPTCCTAGSSVRTPYGCSNTCGERRCVGGPNNGATCSTNAVCVPPYGTCIEDTNCTPCTGTDFQCTTELGLSCGFNAGTCGYLNASQCIRSPSSSCRYSAGTPTPTPTNSSTPTPTVAPTPTPTPGGGGTPTPTPNRCGNNTCNSGESCSNCSQDCGQCSTPTPSPTPSGCTGGATDGVPGNTTITPANNGTVNITSETITVSWTTASKADYYQLQLYPAGTSCSNANAHCVTVTGTSYNFSPATGVTQYTFRVRPVNSSCGTDLGNWAGPNTFNISAQITGNFYLGEGTISGNSCVPTGSASNSSPGTGASINANNGTYAGSITNNTYGITAPYWPSTASPNYTVRLTPGTDSNGLQYVCSCPVGCAYSGIASPQTGVNFYFQAANLANGGWWQIQNGSAYAGQSSGAAIASQMSPTFCTTANGCTPAISIRDSANRTDSAGVPVTGGGEIDSSSQAGFQTSNITQETTQAYGKGAVNVKFRENYDYFYRLYSMGLDPGAADDFAATANNAQKPTLPPLGEKRAYFHEGDMTIQTLWNVAANESIVVFVDGNLFFNDTTGSTANDQLTNVAPGGFLAFIVSGDITVDRNVGNSTLTSTNANLEGLFIADDQIIIDTRTAAAGGDDRFVGEGTFVGWNGVELRRDFASASDPNRAAENNTKPAELFVFRPDFVVNLPERMATPRYIWQETN